MNNSKQQFTQSIKKGANYTEDNQNYMQKDGNALVNNANSVSIKGKLYNIEEQSNNIAVDINGNATDADLLKTQKNSLNEILKVKLSETREILTDKLNSMEDGMRRYFEDQMKENNNYIKQLDLLIKEKVELTSNIQSLEARLKYLEDQIGYDDFES